MRADAYGAAVTAAVGGALLLGLTLRGGLWSAPSWAAPTWSLNAVMLSAVNWIREQGPLLGPVYYMAFLSVWVALLLPCSVLEMVPGFLFGFNRGVWVSIVGKNVGTVASLLIGRYVLKERFQARVLARYPMLQALEKAIQQEGFTVMFMIRVTYLPMVIKNYGTAVLDIDLMQMWLASVLASFPFAALWTFLGAQATNMADIFDGRISARDLLPDNALLVGSTAAVALAAFFYWLWTFTLRFKAILRQVQGGLHSNGHPQAAPTSPPRKSFKAE
jgi:uncharacterized membrane protein YdjX (TVP38/TMEM64 family)